MGSHEHLRVVAGVTQCIEQCVTSSWVQIVLRLLDSYQRCDRPFANTVLEKRHQHAESPKGAIRHLIGVKRTEPTVVISTHAEPKQISSSQILRHNGNEAG